MINSPDFNLIKELIVFDKKQPQPLYVQASQQLISAIQRGILVKGNKLPGTRKLSKLLKINRNTAVAIYEELASQGWIDIIPNKGSYVLQPNFKGEKLQYKTQKSTYEYPKKTGFPFRASFHLSSTKESSNTTYSINDGKPDLRLHPTYQFSRWYNAAMKRKNLIPKWNNVNEKTNSIFQQQLCNYLNATRGFRVNPNNILSTRSTEMSLYIVSQILLKPKDIVIVGVLSNYATNMIFQQVGATIYTVPVDENGINVDFIKNNFSDLNIRCVYVCSQRHYPTTVSLSAERRLQLIQLAKEYNFAIIEDDYDYDFQYDGNAMLPIATADEAGNVIYLGKLGQSLFPSFQTGFIVAPENFISETKNYLQILDKQGDLIQEQILSELILEGEMYRLEKKNINFYKERRDLTITYLHKYFKSIAKWKIPSGGLAIWIEFKDTISLVSFAKFAEQNHVFLPKTILYQDAKTCAIRFGFGHLNLEEIANVIPNLQQAYYQLKEK